MNYEVAWKTMVREGEGKIKETEMMIEKTDENDHEFDYFEGRFETSEVLLGLMKRLEKEMKN